MSTRPVLAGLALVVALATAACSGDSGDDSSATTSAVPSTVTTVAVDTTPVDTGDLPPIGTGDLPPIGTGDLPPIGTGDLPPIGTGDLPLPPVSSDVPYVLSVTVGLDSDPDRIEQVPLGSTLTLTIVNPDDDDEFHLHGYDLGDDEVVPAGQPVSYTFTATEAGSFELESHTTEDVLLILEVV